MTPQECMELVLEDGRREGFQMGLEAAAKKLEEVCRCAEQGFQDCDHSESASNRIRALSYPESDSEHPDEGKK